MGFSGPKAFKSFSIHFPSWGGWDDRDLFRWCRLSQAQTVAEKQQAEGQEVFLKCVPRRVVDPMVEQPEPHGRVLSPILDPVAEKLGPEGIIKLQKDGVFSRVGVAIEKHYMETGPGFKPVIAAARQDIITSPREHMLAEAAKAVGPEDLQGQKRLSELRGKDMRLEIPPASKWDRMVGPGYAGYALDGTVYISPHILGECKPVPVPITESLFSDSSGVLGYAGHKDAAEVMLTASHEINHTLSLLTYNKNGYTLTDGFVEMEAYRYVMTNPLISPEIKDEARLTFP